MLRIVYLVPFLLLLSGCFNDKNEQLNNLYNDGDSHADALLQGAEHIEFLYRQQRGGMQVSSTGRIAKILDLQRSPYEAQLILVRLSSGRKLIIKHNIEKAEMVPDLVVGEMITFKGLYSWNSKGGMIVSTYQDIDEAQRSGWLKYQDVTYQ